MNWKAFKLEEIVDTARGITYGIVQPGTFQKTGGVPILKVNNLTEGKYTLEDTDKVSEEIEGKYSRTRLKGNEILISIVGSLGHVFKVTYKQVGWNVVRAIAVLPIKEGIDRNWVYYSLKNPVVQNELIQRAMHTVQATLNLKELKEIKIHLPDFRTQTAISSILSSLDDKIELNNATNKNLLELAQLLFEHWFVDFEFPDKSSLPYKSSGGKMKESASGEIPSSWAIGSIYDVSEVIYGAPFKSALFNQEGNGLPLIRIRDLKKYKPQFWTDEKHPKGTRIKAGDLVVGMDAEFRPHIWLDEDAWLNQRVCHFKPKTDYSRLFVWETIDLQLLFFENSSVGTTVIHLGKGDIDTFRSLIPEKQVLRMFEELTEPLLDSIVNNCKENNRLIELRDTILPKLMAGELTLQEAEKLTQTPELA